MCGLSVFMFIKKRNGGSFQNTVLGHGWYQLSPFGFDAVEGTLSFTFHDGETVREIRVRETAPGLRVSVPDKGPVGASIETVVKRVLRHGEPFAEFFSMVESDESYSWIAESGFGPLLRSPTVFEDIIKTMCTTNCSWSLTKSMVTNLVGKLGEESTTGTRAFPTPQTMASQTEKFYKEEIRSGYRGPYLLEFAQAVSDGKVDTEAWLVSEKPTADLKKEIKAIKGIGDYAAEHILKMIGRYDGLALDSFLRSEFYKVHTKGKVCPDKKIESHYKRFKRWQGLVIWFDMTRG